MASEYILSQPQTQESERGLRILISTDNHLGYKERHPIRGGDSFDAFDEVLKKASENKVDLIILGGDLFHEMNPSQESLIKCVQIFRKYIFGPREIKFDCYWDSNVPNFFNENINIELPIFIIHGNHDMPASEYGNLSVLDLLHVGNYVNYFGKTRNYDELEVVPILIHKGDFKIALYGIGYIKDIRLHQILEQKKYKFRKPENFKDYFNILVIHQNAYKGITGADYKNCIHPKMLPKFINLVIWGHEHESIDEIFQNQETGHYIYQPGSSVMTSLIEAEGKMKHAGLIHITKGNFTLNTLFLSDSHRPLLFSQIELSDLIEKKRKRYSDINLPEEGINEELAEEILLEEINRLLAEHERSPHRTNDKLPLIRVKVEYTGFDILRVQRIEAKYKGRVANEGEILRFWKRKNKKNNEHIKNNEKLQEKFVKTLESKTTFNTLGRESLAEIKQLYHKNLRGEPIQVLPSSLILKKFDFVEEEELDNRNFRNRQTIIDETLENLINSTVKAVSKEYISPDLNGLQKDYSSYMTQVIRDIKKKATKPNDQRERPGSNKLNVAEEQQGFKRRSLNYSKEAPELVLKINYREVVQKVFESLYPDAEFLEENIREAALEAEEDKIKNEDEGDSKMENPEKVVGKKVIKGSGRQKKEEIIVLSDSSAQNEPGKKRAQAPQKQKTANPRGKNKKTDKKCCSSDDEEGIGNAKKRVFDPEMEIKEEDEEAIDEFNFSKSKPRANEKELISLKKKAEQENKHFELKKAKPPNNLEKHESQSQLNMFFTKAKSTKEKDDQAKEPKKAQFMDWEEEEDNFLDARKANSTDARNASPVEAQKGKAKEAQKEKAVKPQKGKAAEARKGSAMEKQKGDGRKGGGLKEQNNDSGQDSEERKEEVFMTLDSEEGSANRKKFVKKSTDKSRFNPFDFVNSDEENEPQVKTKEKTITAAPKDSHKAFSNFLSNKKNPSLLSPVVNDSEKKRRANIQELISDSDSDDRRPFLSVGKKGLAVSSARPGTGASPRSSGKRSDKKEGFL